ncbi:MAG: class I SAM-dependent methyltransferase [Anaerolineales bacterium]|nr:methyltransferase domain-containing protein [Anaerolineales bacterium]WKZ39737.1 MAG: class I SAM-dependent methyltransferase [Anaerolineales bacterium]
MLNKLLFHRFPNLKSLLTRLQYEFISALNVKRDVIFMNFGYTAHHQGHEPIPLDPDDEIHRYPLQLYHYVAKHVDWENADALEVSSGRGGGANFIMRYFKPRSYTGVDFSARAIDFCREQYDVDGLKFQHGNAEALTFPENSFDVVVNVEASLYYPNIKKFFQHVKRILKPGGHFLYTDLRYEEKVADWHAQIEAMGLKLIKKEDITENVLKAMELDRERRIWLVNTYIPAILRKQFLHFAGLSPNSPNALPHLDNRRYWYFVLQKA